MDDLTLRYYEAEMRYLREAGREFAEAHPDRAAMLNLDKVGDRDPYVERLFEGFAFLMGRLREKLDDDLPELTEGLVSLLCPHYLRTIPSLSIVELAPDYRQLKHGERVVKGTEVVSRPMGTHHTRCRYRSIRDMPLLPLRLSQAGLHTRADGLSVIRLRFDCGPLADWRKVDIGRLAIYINADGPAGGALHLALTRQVHAMTLRFPDGQGMDEQDFAGYFSPMGFGPDDALWPQGESAFSGYQLLLEYFTFREKFMFVALNGLENVRFPAALPWFEVDIAVSEPWPRDVPFSEENLRLHCVPVINLFYLDADPLPLTALESEYLLRPLRLQDGHIEIYSVDEVRSSHKSQRHDYVPFTSFRHRGGMLRHDAPERYYHTRVRRGPSGLHDTWLILGGEAFEAEKNNGLETLSLRMTGTHGQLPRRALRGTVLDTLVDAGPVPLQVRNLCAPTPPCYPPANDRFHWRILSHLGSGFLCMMDNAEVLRGTLSLYDWTGDEMNRRRLAAIVRVEHHLIRRVDKGCVLRGVGIDITLNADGFVGEGDISLFGELLHRFFMLYADIHLFNQLTLILQPTGKSLRWPQNHSQRIPG